MYIYNFLVTLALTNSALSASSIRSTVHVTVTATTTITPGVDAASPAKPIVTVIVTEYTTVISGIPQTATNLPPHTVSNIHGGAPTHDGVPSGCVMVCPPGFTDPFVPTFTSNTSYSWTSNMPTGAVSVSNPKYTLFTPEPKFKTVISSITNLAGKPTGSATCPHSMSHSVPAGETSGPEGDVAPMISGAVSKPSSTQERSTLQTPEATDDVRFQPPTTDSDVVSPTMDTPSAESSPKKFLLSSTNQLIQTDSTSKESHSQTTNGLDVPDVGKSYMEEGEPERQNESRSPWKTGRPVRLKRSGAGRPRFMRRLFDRVG